MRHLVKLVLIPCLVIVGCATEDGGSTTTDPNAPPPPPASFTMEGRWDVSMGVDMFQVFGTDIGQGSITCTTGGGGAVDHLLFDAAEKVSGGVIELPNCGTISRSPFSITFMRIAETVRLSLNYIDPGFAFYDVSLELSGDLIDQGFATSVGLSLVGFGSATGLVRFDTGPNERRYQIDGVTLSLFRLEVQ